MAPAAAPPSPQEIHRKLSVHSAARSKPPPVTVPPVSGTESDSDSILTPDPYTLSPSGMVSSLAAGSLTGAQQPLSSIAERRSGSGGEDSEDDDDEGEGGWKTADVTTAHPQGSADEKVIKAGYLWKKGERRKTWKKRWFVLRPAHLAYYKTAAEYQLLRLLELSDVHSCTQVSLKRHDNAFGLVSPLRTLYLQASTPTEVQEWVQAIEETRQKLLGSVAGASTTPIPIPRASDRAHFSPPPVTPSPPSHTHNATSSDSEDGSPSYKRTKSMSSQTRPVVASSPSKSQTATAVPKDSGKTVLSGYLMKCGSKRRNWRKRWFVLSGEKLMYSASHMDVKPHRQFALSDILDALEYEVPHRQFPPPASSPSFVVSESEDPQSAHTFKIVTTKRTLLLCAPTEEDEIKWLGAVRALIARRGSAAVPGGDANKTVSAATNVNDVSPNNSTIPAAGQSGSSGIKAKVRRLSLSGSGFSNREEKEKETGSSAAPVNK
ncbi:PH-domain-containing protein [Dendrothele bispora CBS 962.96]|uniref:PH-domain-containing protein n=1 Tax=Dendrothele bispora (strain CBS 962.96) TaxID=1314807 RepID=A0A4S8MX29_DENBC|nr:PH-domain-containing protein [Dendrothele bispora CBS 962.96]